MNRAIVLLAALVAGVCVCFVPSRSPSGRAEAADDALTAEVKAKLDASLIVFAGKIAELGPASTNPDEGSEAVQWVAYDVEVVLKGACKADRFIVEHVVRDHPNLAGPGLDPGYFATGTRMLVGVQLHRGSEAPTYTLRNAAGQFGPSVMTDTLLRDVMQYVNPALFARAVELQRRATCKINLTMLAQVYQMEAQENRAKAQKYSGGALWLRYRKAASEIKRGDERALLCPDDPDARLPREPSDYEAWDKVDLAHPQPGLCSYAGRDFARCPLPEGGKPEPIGACLHHPGGVVVSFDDGSAKFLTLKELGLDSEADKVVGPDSKSPQLRVLR